MSKMDHLQNCLEDIFDEFTPKFANKMHWIQLEYHVERNKQILVFNAGEVNKVRTKDNN